MFDMPDSKGNGDGSISVRGIAFNRQLRTLSRGLRQRRISPVEARLLDAFLGQAGEVLSREALRAAVWPHDDNIQLRTVDAHVGRLRQTFRRLDDKRAIVTVRGQGYVLTLA